MKLNGFVAWTIDIRWLETTQCTFQLQTYPGATRQSWRLLNVKSKFQDMFLWNVIELVASTCCFRTNMFARSTFHKTSKSGKSYWNYQIHVGEQIQFDRLAADIFLDPATCKSDRYIQAKSWKMDSKISNGKLTFTRDFYTICLWVFFTHHSLYMNYTTYL